MNRDDASDEASGDAEAIDMLWLHDVPHWFADVDTSDPATTMNLVFDRVLAEPTHRNIVFAELLLHAFDEDERLRAVSDRILEERGTALAETLLAGEGGHR